MGIGDEQDRFRILGIPVNITNLLDAAELVIEWSKYCTPRTVFVRDVPSLMSAVDEPRLAELHESADLIVPDGTPLVWTGRIHGIRGGLGRVPGADLVEEVSSRAALNGRRVFFYGGGPGIAEEMSKRLKDRYPDLQVAGLYCPPMREIGPDFAIDDDVSAELEIIKASSPDIVWVGLSSPKQEYWMMKAAPVVGQGVFLGVGAAFDFHSGAKRRSPKWMRNNGLEWLHRLISEPRRLWRRYLISAPRFVLGVLGERLFLKS